jgi:hypothetical protein
MMRRVLNLKNNMYHESYLKNNKIRTSHILKIQIKIYYNNNWYDLQSAQNLIIIWGRNWFETINYLKIIIVIKSSFNLYLRDLNPI